MRKPTPNFIVIARLSMLRNHSPRVAVVDATPAFYNSRLYWPVAALILAVGLAALRAATH